MRLGDHGSPVRLQGAVDDRTSGGGRLQGRERGGSEDLQSFRMINVLELGRREDE